VLQLSARLRAHLHAWLVLAHALARPADDLATGRFALAEDFADRTVVRIEQVVQQERGALLGCQPLEHREEGHGQVRRQFRGAVRGRRGVQRQWFGQPRPDVVLALGAQLRSRSMHKRVVAVTSQASGERISWPARSQRSQASCTMSSASAREPSMR
jgi:hypothetical protein